MNYLWPILIIASYVYAVLTGNIESVNNSIFSSVSDVVKLALTLLGNMCLWCGIMNIVKSTSIINWLNKILMPLLNWLYPNEKNNKEVMDEISMNTIANMLGIGNAATPAGLKAMEKMQKNNPDKSKTTDSMTMLIVLNTTSIQIIPTTVLAIRSSLESSSPSEVITPIWISTMAGTVIAILVTKLILRKNKRGD